MTVMAVEYEEEAEEEAEEEEEEEEEDCDSDLQALVCDVHRMTTLITAH